jgi:transposase
MVHRARIEPAKLPWIAALLARRPARVVTVAVANKLARIAWAVLSRAEVYRHNVVAAA